MKKTIFLFLWTIHAMAQQTPQQTIEQFFAAFHQKDTVALKQFLHKNLVLQTVIKNKNNEVRTENANDFLKGIAAIPVTMKFKEELSEVLVREENDLAQVWTPYIFYANGQKSHAGTNAFTLIKVNNKWQILYLVDTRRR